MIQCRNCGEDKADHHFAKGRTICYPCKYVLAGGSRHDPAYMKEYVRKHAHRLRHKAYLTHDRKRYGGNENSVDSKTACEMMSQPCYYCGLEPSGGLDRIDNSKGHEINNVRPCCEKCNFLLGDIPDAAKVIMIPSLTTIRERGLLTQWTIPTKRKKLPPPGHQ